MVTASFPSKFPIQWRTWQSGGRDPLNNPIDAWGDPFPVMVIGWSSRRVLSRDGEHEVEDTDHLDLMVNNQFSWGVKDHVIIPGRGEYMVEGIKDPGHGFHGWQPGITLSLLLGEG
jgi:hypothetical protein